MALRYLSADQLLADAQQLAVKIVASGFQPDLLVALWRGGAPVGMAIHEVLALAGTACEHLPLRAESYTGIDRQLAVRFHGLEVLWPLLQNSARVLLVDDVFDTGRTMEALCSHIHAHSLGRPLLLKIATPWYKSGKNLTALVPDFHLHTTDDWLVFPHELQHLTDAQILDKPGNQTLLRQLADLRRSRPQTSQPPR